MTSCSLINFGVGMTWSYYASASLSVLILLIIIISLILRKSYRRNVSYSLNWKKFTP